MIRIETFIYLSSYLHIYQIYHLLQLGLPSFPKPVSFIFSDSPFWRPLFYIASFTSCFQILLECSPFLRQVGLQLVMSWIHLFESDLFTWPYHIDRCYSMYVSVFLSTFIYPLISSLRTLSNHVGPQQCLQYFMSTALILQLLHLFITLISSAFGLVNCISLFWWYYCSCLMQVLVWTSLYLMTRRVFATTIGYNTVINRIDRIFLFLMFSSVHPFFKILKPKYLNFRTLFWAGFFFLFFCLLFVLANLLWPSILFSNNLFPENSRLIIFHLTKT